MATLTHEEMIVSLPLKKEAGSSLMCGWQEMRLCTFTDYISNGHKTTQHRLRAEIHVGFDDTNSYGEVAVWASATWKPILRAGLPELPKLSLNQSQERECYDQALDWLFAIGRKVAG